MRRCSAAAPRTRCGTTGSTTQPCSPFSPTISRPPPRAATCWRALCSPKATAPAPRPWCATPGATRIAAPTSRARCSKCSATCSRAPTTRRAWSSASTPTTSRPACAPPQRLGGNELAIARARAAVIKRLNNAKALLDAVPAAARSDPGYIFARVQWLRQHDKPEEAGKLILTAPQDPDALVDLNQWWVERRILVRKLLDDGDAANRLSRGARRRLAAAGQLPRRPAFHRRLDRAALSCTTRKPPPPISPISRKAPSIRMRSRAAAIGRAAPPTPWASTRKPRPIYEMAAKYTATYYGQLARARLGLDRSRPARPARVHAAGAPRARQSRSRARGGNSLRARRARHAGLDLCRDRRKRHRYRRHGGAGRARRQA